MTAPKQITKSEMQALLDEHCPTMSPPTREAVLSGSVLGLDGEEFQAPVIEHARPTHHTTARIVKAGTKWLEPN